MSNYLGIEKTERFLSGSDDMVLEQAKELVINDFVAKVVHFIQSNVMLPNSTLLYEIFYKRYGIDTSTFEQKFNTNNRHLDGLKIETDEIVEKIQSSLEIVGELFYKEHIKKFFGAGEFPFLITDIYRKDDCDIITYYISR